MNANNSLLMRNIFLLGMFAFCGCTYFDFDDESDYAPGIQDVVGCWVSTENLSTNVLANMGTSSLPDYQYVGAFPSKTCIEFCVQEDSSFTYIAKFAAGLDYFPDFSASLYGTVDVRPVNALGEGGTSWVFNWSKRNVVKSSDGVSSKQKYDFVNMSDIRLVDGKLNGLRFDGLKYEDNNRHIGFYSESERIFSRSSDKNACDDFTAN
ncbi:MAG: hypothetical protein J6W51_11470 [Fibrobacter sp.]|nr:hypothetical protein [Fibrobacter sp.]